MASATGIPETNARLDERNDGYGEDEPLLGRPGDASQHEDSSLWTNLYSGTAFIAQAGLVLLTAIVFANTLITAPISLFSAHPLLNSTALLLLVEGIIILQPTHTATQKRRGTYTHASLNALAASSFIAAFVVIEYNKFAHHAPHFTSVHGVLGLITYILLGIQAIIGFTQYFVPSLYGGPEQAKRMYKFHRASGYVVLVMALAAVAAATQTDTVRNMLKIRLWSVLLCAVLILVGLLPRVKVQKFGLSSWGIGGRS